MRSFVRIVAALFAALLLAIPTTASAAAAPVPWDSVDVVIHNENGSNVILVSGDLPANTKLPADVELAVPTGGQFQWAGEILGGPPAQDPSVDYKVKTVGDMDIYSFRLTKSRTGQVEVLSPSTVVFDGQTYSANVKWTAPSALKVLRVGFRVPQGAQVQTPAEGASMEPGPSGYSYYRKEIKNLKQGQAESFAFAFTAPAATTTGGGAAGAASSNNVPLYIVFAVFGVGMFFAWRGVQRKMQARETADEEFVEDEPVYAIEEHEAAEHAEGQYVADDDSEEYAEEDAEEAPTDASGSKSKLLVWGVVGALTVAVVAAVLSGNSGTQTGDTVMMQYAQVDACTTTSIPLSSPAGGDLANDANKILGTLRTLQGVGSATLYLKESRVQVDYCTSSANDQQIAQALAGSGYTVGTPVTGPAGSQAK